MNDSIAPTSWIHEPSMEASSVESRLEVAQQIAGMSGAVLQVAQAVAGVGQRASTAASEDPRTCAR
eukprot:5521990-Pyramimonas_sp.AAC.1